MPRRSQGNDDTVLNEGRTNPKVLRMSGGSRATCRAQNRSRTPNSRAPHRRFKRRPAHQIDHTALNPNRGPTEATRIAFREPQGTVFVKAIAASLTRAATTHFYGKPISKSTHRRIEFARTSRPARTFCQRPGQLRLKLIFIREIFSLERFGNHDDTKFIGRRNISPWFFPKTISRFLTLPCS